MAININGFPRIIQELTDREVAWIDAQLCDDYQEAERLETKRIRIEEFMHRDEECYRAVKELRLDSNLYLLADDELEWMESTDRKLLSWLKIRHTSSGGTEPHHKIVASPLLPREVTSLPDASFYRAYISHLDCWREPLQIKRGFLSLVKSEWYQQQQLDKKLKWIDMGNPGQITWIWEYLQQNLIHTPYYALSINFNPTSNEETYFSIYSRFYEWQGHPAALKEIQGKMKQAWAQQKYRASLKGRKQSTYVLSDGTKNQLKTLAKANNVNLNQMLEYIINDAYKNFKKRKPKENSQKDDDHLTN